MSSQLMRQTGAAVSARRRPGPPTAPEPLRLSQFPLPSLMKDKGLTDSAKLLWCLLDASDCLWEQEQIAQALGQGLQTVRRGLMRLVESGWLAIISRSARGGHVHRYITLHRSEPVDPTATLDDVSWAKMNELRRWMAAPR